MSRIAFVPVIIAAMVAAILSPSVFANSFAKSSDADSGGGDRDSGDDKRKTSDHRKGDDGGGGMPVPGVPAVRADNKDKHNNKDSNNGGGRLIVPGSPVVTADIGNGNDNTAYNNGNIKEFDTSKSSFRIGGSDGKVVQYVPGFNETFYNSTLPYCFAVQSGSCYNTATGQIMP